MFVASLQTYKQKYLPNKNLCHKKHLIRAENEFIFYPYLLIGTSQFSLWWRLSGAQARLLG